MRQRIARSCDVHSPPTGQIDRDSLAKVGDMELGRGPRYEKDSDDLANSLSGGAVKVGLFVLVTIFVLSLLVGVLS